MKTTVFLFLNLDHNPETVCISMAHGLRIINQSDEHRLKIGTVGRQPTITVTSQNLRLIWFLKVSVLVFYVYLHSPLYVIAFWLYFVS